MTADWSDWPGLEEARRRSGLDSSGSSASSASSAGWTSGSCGESPAPSWAADGLAAVLDERRWLPGTLLPEYHPGE